MIWRNPVERADGRIERSGNGCAAERERVPAEEDALGSLVDDAWRAAPERSRQSPANRARPHVEDRDEHRGVGASTSGFADPRGEAPLLASLPGTVMALDDTHRTD